MNNLPEENIGEPVQKSLVAQTDLFIITLRLNQ